MTCTIIFRSTCIHAGVQYLTGQYFDIQAITKAAHSKVNLLILNQSLVNKWVHTMF